MYFNVNLMCYLKQKSATISNNNSIMPVATFVTAWLPILRRPDFELQARVQIPLAWRYSWFSSAAQVFLRVLRFSHVSIVVRMFHYHVYNFY